MRSMGKLVFYNTWAVLFCDEDLRKYYTSLLERDRWIKVMIPKWGSHISVIRGDGEVVSPEYRYLWNKYHEHGIEFEYSVDVEEAYGGNGRYYYWLPIKCSQILDIREELGLSREPIVSNGLHLTLGSIF